MTTQKEDQLTEISNSTQLDSISSGILYFYADFHDSHENMLLILNSILSNIKIYSINAELVSTNYMINLVPSLIVLKNNIVIDRIDGTDAQQTISLIKKHSTSNEFNLQLLLNSHEILAFINGTPTECTGDSKKMVDLLSTLNARFATFNINSNESCFNQLKRFSSSIPLLFLDGFLIGDLNEIVQFNQDGTLVKKLRIISLNDRISSIIKSSRVLVFIKGTRTNPKCGFSRQICEILKNQDIEFETFDILEDEDVREGLKEYSSWPTFPQLYVDEEFMGGLDIVKEMVKSGQKIA